jgi:hypothetical protein
MSTTTMRSDSHRVGAGLSVRFSFDADRLNAEWTPRPPTKREWKRVIDAYRAARHLFLAELGRRMGGAVLCVEVAT